MPKKKFFRKPSNTFVGILWMLVNALSMAALYVIGKKLMRTFHPNQVAFLYKFGALLTALPWCFKGGLVTSLHTTKIWLHVARGVFSALGTVCFYIGLKNLDAADVTAITYLEQIIVLGIGVMYFGETFTKAKVILIVSGIIGAILVIKPGFTKFDNSYIYVFLALIFWALNNSAIKVLGRTEKTRTQLFYATFFGALVALPLAMQYSWNSVDSSQILYAVLLIMFHLIQVIAFFRALKKSDISTVMPVDYTRLIFISIFAYIALSEVPDYLSLAGYASIMFGGIYLIYDEGRRNGWLHKEER